MSYSPSAYRFPIKIYPSLPQFLIIIFQRVGSSGIHTKNMIPKIVNQTPGKWEFEKVANILSELLWVDIEEDFGDISYILCETEK